MTSYRDCREISYLTFNEETLMNVSVRNVSGGDHIRKLPWLPTIYITTISSLPWLKCLYALLAICCLQYSLHKNVCIVAMVTIGSCHGYNVCLQST